MINCWADCSKLVALCSAIKYVDSCCMVYCGQAIMVEINGPIVI